MNKYKLQINDIKKYAREYWKGTERNVRVHTQDYVDKMTTDTSELHNHICDALVMANCWGFNCGIPKEDFTIQEIDENNNIVKTYSYQEVWDQLPKIKVNYKRKGVN